MTHDADPGRDQDRGRLPVPGRGADRYAMLPDTTRTFLESLHDDDVTRLSQLTTLLREKGGTDKAGAPSIDKIKQGLEMVEAVTLMGRWSKWMSITAASIAGGILSILLLWDKLRSYGGLPPTGGPHP